MPIFKLPLEFIDAPHAYAATNGYRLFVNPFLWMPLIAQEQEAVMYHEWIHIAMFHSKRMKSRKARIWNFAGDFTIDYHITDDINPSKMVLPAGMLYDPCFRGLTTEEVYKILEPEVEALRNKIKLVKADPNASQGQGQSQDQDQSQNQDNGNPSPGAGSNGNNGNGRTDSKQKNKTNSKEDKYCNKPRAVEALAMEQFFDDLFSDDLIPAPTDADLKDCDLISEIIKAAEMHKRLRGTLPGFYEQLIKRLNRSQVPWEQIFHSFFKEIASASADRSFAKPKRWAWSFGIVLPSEIGPKKLNVIYITDTSGSMQASDFEQVGGEIKKLLPLISKLTMVSCDCNVHEKVTVRQIHDIMGDAPKYRFAGRGGTDFVPALLEVAKMPHDLVIYHTDGYGNYGKSCPRGIKNLMWILTNDECQKPPFGRFLILN
jgi:predicted metal-dependent peptidase